jgi:hypothetical protein
MCLLLLSAVAEASPTTYTSAGAFFGALSGPPQILNFDSLSPHTAINTQAGITFTYTFGPQLEVRKDFGTTSPSNYLGVGTVDGTFLNGELFIMDFASPVTALGLYIIGAPDANVQGDFSLAVPGIGGLSNGGVDLFLADGDAYFLGIIDPAGFSQAIVIGGSASCSQPNCQYVWNVDDITTVAAPAVPEPSTLLLVAPGVVGFARMAWRRPFEAPTSVEAPTGLGSASRLRRTGRSTTRRNCRTCCRHSGKSSRTSTAHRPAARKSRWPT